MNSQAEFRLQIAHERRAEERWEASQYRLAASLPRRSAPSPIRGSIGRSLIRLGERLGAEAERSFEPARPR